MSAFYPGEFVEVRNDESEEWQGPYMYLGSMTLEWEVYITMVDQFDSNGKYFNGMPTTFRYIRKPEPKP
jgi:hypothetical protein